MFPFTTNILSRRLALALSIFVSITAFSQSKKYPSLLWKISGKGLKKESYLYGTMHVSKKLAYHLSDQFFEALNNAEVVGLETNPAEWMGNMDTYGMFDEQKINRSSYGGGVSNFYEDAFKINFLNNRAYGSVLSFDPDIINALLFRLTQSKENFEENTYIDLFIYQAAIKWNKSIVSLEDFKTSLLKGRLAEIPDPETEGESSLIKKYQSYYEVFEKIEDAYRKGNLDELDSLNKVSGRTKNFQKYLLEDRNEIFVRSIDSIMAKQSIFAGVGAAHLAGKNGVIELLRKKGYTVEPVMPKISEKNQKLREEIEGMVKTLSFKTYYAADSLFSYSAPGRLVTIQRDVNSSFLLYPDMANGSYYSVGRCKTFAPLINYDVAKMKQKVDSLLYENIPGKIISRKEITSPAGWPGFDVINKTKRGDLQRYHIYFTDLEMIVFKLAGREGYINSEDARNFFASIEFTGKNQAFINYSPPTAGFTVKFPSNLFYEHSYGSQEVGVGENLIGFDKPNQTVYGVIHAYYNDAEFIEEDTFELNVLANNVLKNFNFKEADSRVFKKHQGFPDIELSAKNESQFMNARIIIKGVHYYFVYAVGLGKKPNASDFFNSFTLTDFRYVNKVKEVTDQNYFFKVRDELTESPSEDFEKEYRAEAAKVETVKETGKKRPYENDYRNKYYFSPSSCEHVNIELNKINDYSSINKAEIGDFLKKPFKSASFNIVSETITEKDGIFRCEIIVNDTASVRAIKVVYIIKNGLIYTLSSPYDANLGLRGWAKEFFETFTPMD
ncbi:MAG: TraB/GumN family protein, partial [Bacteroidia bacterium]